MVFESASPVEKALPCCSRSAPAICLPLMGYPFSDLRISATVGLAIDRLSNPKAKTMAMIGSGRLAMPILEPAIAVRSIAQVFVYSRSAGTPGSVRAKGK